MDDFNTLAQVIAVLGGLVALISAAYSVVSFIQKENTRALKALGIAVICAVALIAVIVVLLPYVRAPSGRASAPPSPSPTATPIVSCSPTPAYVERSLTVDAAQQAPTDAGVCVLKGEKLAIVAYGYACYAGLNNSKTQCVSDSTTDPDGYCYSDATVLQRCTVRMDAFAFDGKYPVGALVGYIGAGSVLFVGHDYTATVTNEGELYLAYNDTKYSDNFGAFNVTVTVSPT